MVERAGTLPMYPNFRIVNVIAATKVNRPIDLELLARKLTSVAYNPRRFCGLIYRRSKPKFTIIMFTTGKIVSIGTTSEEEAKNSILSTISDISRIERKKTEAVKITIENVVAVSYVGHQVDIEKFVSCGIKMEYEPEQFPGVICRLSDGTGSLVFKSGMMVTTGAKSEHEARSIALKALSLLRDCSCLLR